MFGTFVCFRLLRLRLDPLTLWPAGLVFLDPTGMQQSARWSWTGSHLGQGTDNDLRCPLALCQGLEVCWSSLLALEVWFEGQTQVWGLTNMDVLQAGRLMHVALLSPSAYSSQTGACTLIWSLHVGNCCPGDTWRWWPVGPRLAIP